MRSIEGIFTLQDYQIDRLFRAWGSPVINYGRYKFVYNPAQPRLSLIILTEVGETLCEKGLYN